MPTDTIHAVRAATLALKAEASALRFRRAAYRLHEVLAKANFDPNQPRAPRGQPDGGQWIHVPVWSSDRRRQTPRPTLVNDDGDKPPEVPSRPPPRARDRNVFIKSVARWLYRGVRVAAGASPLGRALDAYEAGLWIYDHWPYIVAYLDGPKSLDELQRAVSTPRKGYDIHHIVERGPAIQDGYQLSRVDAPENLVRIPTLKHWQITGWFATKSDDFGGLSPRDYLRGQSWDERLRVGRIALIKYEVLRP